MGERRQRNTRLAAALLALCVASGGGVAAPTPAERRVAAAERRIAANAAGADAHSDLAAALAQRLLDLRPGSVAALARAAYLRELFGDPAGALELMAKAYDRVAAAEIEDRAWILTQVAQLHRTAGRLDAADTALATALALVPGYHYALGQLAQVRLAQGDAGTAIALLERRYRAAPHPENLYDLARALHAGGRTRDARVAFVGFERAARTERDRADNANHELVFYYVDTARRPAAAAAVAAAELRRRRDVRTLEACGWALAATGQLRAARACIDDAIAVGIRDAELYYRAGSIARRQGDAGAARALLRESLAINPRSGSAPRARRELRALERQAP